MSAVSIQESNRPVSTYEIALRVDVTHQLWNTLYLYSTYGRTHIRIDSAKLVQGSYQFPSAMRESGFYMIGPADDNVFPVILNPLTEEFVHLKISSTRLDGGCSALQSKENEVWIPYYPKEIALLRQSREARANARRSAEPGSFEKQAQEKENELLQLQNELIRLHPKTYVAKVLQWKQEPSPANIHSYWKNIDFNDQSIIHSTVLGDRIQQFMRSFSRGEDSGFIECIGVIVKQAQVNDAVLEFVLTQMVTGFYESGLEHLSLYIIDTYIHGDACGDTNFSNIILSTAESIERLGIGKTPPSLSGKGVNGEMLELSAIAQSNEFTLLMFWSSWCEHCKGEAPEIVSCYNTWKNKGFEIVGYSVDQNENTWKKAATERSFGFPNMCGYNLWNSPGAKAYRVTRTPAFFLLDKNGTIVLKPKSIREVNQFLSTHLK